MKKRLRDVTRNDLKILFNWRNHPSARNNSFDKSVLTLANHKEWFENVLKSNSSFLYILEIDEVPVGAIRFKIEDRHSAEINYLIDPSKHGKGFGTEILDVGVNRVFKENPGLKKVYGSVLKENLASIKIFEKLSFKKVSGNTLELKFEKNKWK